MTDQEFDPNQANEAKAMEPGFQKKIDSGEMVPINPAVPNVPANVGLFGSDPVKAYENMKLLVNEVAKDLKGEAYISVIPTKQGPKNYPKVEWWSTVGNTLGLCATIHAERRIDRPNQKYFYEAMAVITNSQGRIMGKATMMCSTEENTWKDRDEYAVRSMAQTRAVGKAYRLCLSSLAVMAGVEATPADEVPSGGFENQKTNQNQKGTSEKKPPMENRAQTEQSFAKLIMEESKQGGQDPEIILQRLTAYKTTPGVTDMKKLSDGRLKTSYGMYKKELGIK